MAGGAEGASVTESYRAEFQLSPEDNRRLAWLCGSFNETLQEVERRLRVTINHRGHSFRLKGREGDVLAAMRVLNELYEQAARGPISGETLHIILSSAARAESDPASAPRLEGGVLRGPAQRAHPAAFDEDGTAPRRRGRRSEMRGADEQETDLPEGLETTDAPAIRTRRGTVRPRGPNQLRYLAAILEHDVSFGVGPAGTGKTYLAVAAAVEALETERVRRLVLTRPAVEAGERLGFLPGDMAQKVDPYLRPLYDALFEMLGFERVSKLMERGTIEVAPLAFMRGRTLNESFIILDEAQNTTAEQMKMFLTRIGFGSTAVVTGDVTQVDLPRSQLSGLRQAVDLLQGIEGIHFTFFSAADVVRHPVVARILGAYEAAEARGRAGPPEGD
jgi:phosphate starvation-inducible protein PhoH and related proteins